MDGVNIEQSCVENRQMDAALRPSVSEGSSSIDLKSPGISSPATASPSHSAEKGLDFHHSAETKVIYRDFKTSNVLLDSSYNVKVCDFGLTKDGPEGDKSSVFTRVMGAYGYGLPLLQMELSCNFGLVSAWGLFSFRC